MSAERKGVTLGLFLFILGALYTAYAIATVPPQIPKQMALIQEHSKDIMDLMIGITGFLGSAVLLLLLYIWRQSRSAIVQALADIKDEIHGLRVTMRADRVWMQGETNELKTRVTKIESRHSFEDKEYRYGHRVGDPPLGATSDNYTEKK